MPPKNLHLSQAKHNEELAKELKQGLTYKDWLITTSFYAAVHYLEYWLGCKNRHTETECPNGVSLHDYRASVVNQELDYASDIAYIRLRRKSEIARYLCTGRMPQTGGKISHDFFSNTDAKDSLDFELNTLKLYLRIP